MLQFVSNFGKNPIFNTESDMEFREAIKPYSGQPLTRQILMDVLKEYRRPHDKISELVGQEMLEQVKRGVFIPGRRASLAVPENFLLANHLYGPSYVSSDSALSYWGMIPERVYETISMTTNRGKSYRTPVGRFRYIRLPSPYFSFGMQRVELAENQVALIAGREKALCDKIITTRNLKLRSVKQTRDYLMEDLRISRETLRDLNTELIQDFIKYSPKKESVSILITTLNEL